MLLPAGELAEQEAGLDDVLLVHLLEAAGRRAGHLSLPKIDLDVHSQLTDALKSLGVGVMFSTAADFSALTEGSRLEIFEVLHQAVLRLDEQGLEGVDATVATMRLTSMMVGEPVLVAVDRPFLLLVRHAETGVVYFFSRVIDP